MTTDQQKQNGRRLLAFFQRGEEWLEISGYHVGDVHSEDKPVAITKGATVVGNVFAPKTAVGGLLCGSVVTQQGTIETDGQIWGDVFAIRLTMNAGGKIQGWLSSIDEPTYQELMQNQALPDDVALAEQAPADDTIDNHLLAGRDNLELVTLHRLQTEIATALAARTELENSFETRINEVAGESTGRIAALSEELNEARDKLRDTRQQLETQQEQVQTQKSQIERQGDELAVSRQLIDEQNETLEQLRQQETALQQDVERLTTERDDLTRELQAKVTQIEEQANRMRTLETTMQAGLQHSSELEESLVRWQELAEVTEKKADKLEEELKSAKFQLEENGKLIEMLREQKQQAEQDWATAQEELERLQQFPTRPLNGEDDDEEIDPVERIAALEMALSELDQERTEQILWYRANLETSQSELDRVQRQYEEQQSNVAQLRSDLEKNRSLVDKWKTAADEISTQMREQNKQVQASDEKVNALEARMNEQRLQLEAVEEDLAYHIDAIESQGQHLAEIQAVLAEREVQLSQARELIQKQNTALKQLRQKAEAHISRLQVQIEKLSAS